MTNELKDRISKIRNGEVSEGYKRTKAGILPNDWNIVKLNDVAHHITKKNTKMQYTETLTNSATLGIIRQTDYFEKQISNNENLAGYYVVEEGDYVYNPRISVSAPCGPISKSHITETGIMSPLYTIFRFDNLDDSFFESYFKSCFWHRYMNSIANYGARHDRMNITNDDFFSMPLPFPPLPEQQKIAEILSTQDKVIALEERCIEELKNLKKAYLQKMFPKNGEVYPEIRFKGFTDAWEQRKVGDVLSESRDIGHSGDIAKKLTVKLWGKGVYEKTDKGSAATQYFIRHAGQFIYSKLDFLNSAFGVVPKELESYESTADLPAFDCVDVNPYFMYYRAIQPSFYLSNGMIADGSRKAKRIHVETFLDMPLDLPSKEEQQKIAGYFLDIDHLITLHQRKLEQEKQKKKALMQLLLTGIVRVKV